MRFNPLHSVERRAKRSARRRVRRILALYLVSLVPMNYASTAALTEDLNLTNVKQVTSSVMDQGLANFFTMGLFQNFIDYDFIGSILGIGSSNKGHSDDVIALPQDHTETDDGIDFADVIGQAEIPAHLVNYQPGQFEYGGLDHLGRATSAYGVIDGGVRAAAKDEESQPKENPSGWGQNAKVSGVKLPNGKTYRGYFYNRSHMLADSLGGVETKVNLVTGTRMQNVGANNGKGGMAYTETKVRNFVDQNPQCPVKYLATANYNADELVPRTVTVDVLSCDASINEKVLVYNVMPGYTINYNDGSFTKVG